MLINIKVFFVFVSVMALLTVNSFGQNIERTIKGKTLISNQYPKIEVELNGDFKYLGKFDFTIRDIARGERYVFVEADKRKKIKRMFIAQFEEILPESPEFYRYNFDTARKFGSHKFRQNTYAYSNSESRKENPQGEGVLTEDFLKQKGYKLEDELMMSRFVTVPDAEKKRELILFYIENVSPTKHRVTDFYSGDNETEIWQLISKDLTKRSLKAFKIKT